MSRNPSEDLKLNYPECKSFFPNPNDYIKELIIHVQNHPFEQLKFAIIECLLGDHFRQFFKLYSDLVDFDTLKFEKFILHIKMEVRRNHHNFSYSNRKVYQRLHSITKFCACKLCKVLFKDLNLDWDKIISHPKNIYKK